MLNRQLLRQGLTNMGKSKEGDGAAWLPLATCLVALDELRMSELNAGPPLHMCIQITSLHIKIWGVHQMSG